MGPRMMRSRKNTNGTAVCGIQELESERKAKGQYEMHLGFKNTWPRSERTELHALFPSLAPQGETFVYVVLETSLWPLRFPCPPSYPHFTHYPWIHIFNFIKILLSKMLYFIFTTCLKLTCLLSPANLLPRFSISKFLKYCVSIFGKGDVTVPCACLRAPKQLPGDNWEEEISFSS